MNVLSLCDGMSCGQMAFEKIGIKVDNYYASEIKDIAIKTTQHNFPSTIQIGDVTKVHYENGILHTENGDFKTDIDIVIFGSPCQSFSRAMKADMKIGLEDMERSGLFLECHRVLKEVNPKYFLMENVVMKDEDRDTISKMMGVEPIRINSSLVSAQLRDRYYWTNIPNVTIPQDKGIKLKDILNNGYVPHDKAKCLRMCDSHGFYNGCNWTPIKRFYRYYFKSFGDMIFPCNEYFENWLNLSKSRLNGSQPSAKIFDISA